MHPIPLIFWLLLASAAALVAPQAKALDGLTIKTQDMIGPSFEAAHKARPALTSATPGGIRVARQADALLRASAARSLKVPLTAAATLSKARVSSGAAALCIAFPPRCVGQLALGLGAQIALSQLTQTLQKQSQTYTATGGYSWTSIDGGVYRACPGNGSTMEGCHEASIATARSLVAGIPANQNGPWTIEWVGAAYVESRPDINFNSDPKPLNFTYVRRMQYRRADGSVGSSTLASWRPTAVGPVEYAEATPADINQAFTTNSANWQDSTFAAVFADAVTKGATWPITTFDGGEMVNGPADAVATETQTINSPAGTVTRTTTTTANTVTSGNTVGTAQAVITQRTTTTETGPNGTTTTQTDTAPELENPATFQPDAGTVTPTPEVTVNVEFPEPVFSDTALPEVPDLYEQKYPNGLAGVWAEKGPQLMASTFVASVQGMFPTLSGSGSCPVWAINLNFGAMGDFGTGDISPPCWIWGVIALIFLTTACFTAWRIIFGG